MDDTTRGLGGDRDDITGRADETTRNLDTTGSTAGSTRVPSSRTSAGSRSRSTKTTTRTTASTGTDLDPETEARTRQIQAEIADTREELSETIDALQEKLRPSNIVSDATDRVKTATTERVRHMAESAGETAQDMMRSTRHATSGIVEGARQNPIPALMIGVGIAWLLVDRTRNHDTGRRYRNTSRSQDWRRYGASGTSDRYYRSQNVAGGTGVDLDDDAEYGYAEYGSNYTYGDDRSSSGISRVTERASGMADNARNSLRRSTRGAQNGFQRLLRDNPLLVGAAAIVAGAAVGAALPETERENELMGETRDSMIDKAQELARNIPVTVQEAAGEAVKTVAEKVTTGETGNTNR
jgi:hypothetical protein